MSVPLLIGFGVLAASLLAVRYAAAKAARGRQQGVGFQSEVIDVDRFLVAIALAKNAPAGLLGNYDDIGPYHMTYRVFVRYKGTQLERARGHLAVILRQLEWRGVAPNPFNAALCWETGHLEIVNGRAPCASYQYALRVRAIYERKK